MSLFRNSMIFCTLCILVVTPYSCNKIPETNFTYSPRGNPEAGEYIKFINETPEASFFEWNFGDGTSSNEENPEHLYNEPGDYMVELVATNDAGSQAKGELVTIRIPTTLIFYIVDNNELFIHDAEVWLYDNSALWEEVAEPISKGKSNERGEVIFSNVEDRIYYIWVNKEEKEGIWIFGGSTNRIILNTKNFYSVPCAWLPYESQMKAIQTYPDLKHVDTSRY